MYLTHLIRIYYERLAFIYSVAPLGGATGSTLLINVATSIPVIPVQ